MTSEDFANRVASLYHLGLHGDLHTLISTQGPPADVEPLRAILRGNRGLAIEVAYGAAWYGGEEIRVAACTEVVACLDEEYLQGEYIDGDPQRHRAVRDQWRTHTEPMI